MNETETTEEIGVGIPQNPPPQPAPPPEATPEDETAFQLDVDELA